MEFNVDEHHCSRDEFYWEKHLVALLVKLVLMGRYYFYGRLFSIMLLILEEEIGLNGILI